MISSRQLFAYTLIPVLVGWVCAAKPVDTEVAKKLPEFRSLVSKLSTNQTITTNEVDLLKWGVRSRDPAIISIVAWCDMLLKGKQPEIRRRLEELAPDLPELPRAFVQLRKTSHKIENMKGDQQAEAWRELIASSNPYLRIEAAKQLVKVDVSAGKASLYKLIKDPSTSVAAEARRTLERMGSSGLGPPVPFALDQSYAAVLSAIDQQRY